MSDQQADPWSRPELQGLPPVPGSYRGVWIRTLLQTPEVRDDTTFVRWMQLGRWHADLRIPAAALETRAALPLAQCSAEQREILGNQQGFSGVTEVTAGEAGEICTWHRIVDYQPPGPHPDAGHMFFESPDRVIETGVHGVYREVWHRLPDSTGSFMALAEPARADGQPGTRIFMTGKYLMRVAPHEVCGPCFEISFGSVEAGCWHIQRSTLPELEGQRLNFTATRSSDMQALIHGDLGIGEWSILEWGST
jgi:hypothetical protein